MRVMQSKDKDGQPLMTTNAATAGNATAGAGHVFGGAAPASLAAQPYGAVAIAGAALHASAAAAAGGKHEHSFTLKRFDEAKNAWVNHCSCGAEPAEEI